jgi:two-component system LytT family response regulator
LNYHPDLIVVGEANNGVDAIQLINKFKPDLVFLDVQMPGLNGFEVLGHLEEIPDIIFSTAYDQYALKAFEVHAVDYLLKPYTRDRFDKALSKANTKSGYKEIAPLGNQHLDAEKEYPTRLIAEKGNRYVTLSMSEIFLFEAYGDYCKIHTEKGEYLSSQGIGFLEKKLNPADFMRVHRSYIVQLDKVAELEKYGKGFILNLKDGSKVKVSRGYADKIKEMIL